MGSTGGMMKSMVDHEWTWMGCLTKKQPGNKIVLGSYSAALMYGNLYGNEDLDRMDWEGRMSVSSRELQTYAVNISDDVKDIAGIS